MTGLVPVIHAVWLRRQYEARDDAFQNRMRVIFERIPWAPAWMTGTSPVMTEGERSI
jgi:hypothetical protein